MAPILNTPRLESANLSTALTGITAGTAASVPTASPATV